jgi:antitoxin (DNA-binding transcriptional repressor) of toxin-antitoxin stability system
VPQCDARMSHIMKKTTVRDLRYHFPEIEARLNRGEEIVVHKRQRVIARLLPVRPKAEAYPDFTTLRRRIFGRKKARKTGTDLVSEERGRS